VKNIIRVSLALVVIFAGATLVPAMGLPDQGFNWQLYAGVYNPTVLQANHLAGQPGSFFTFNGVNFSPGTTVTVSANNVVLGTVQASALGDFLFLIDTTGAGTGYYEVKAVGSESVATRINLSASDPLWPKEVDGTVFALPSGIATQFIFLPVLVK
jgi:hypothetical protein